MQEVDRGDGLDYSDEVAVRGRFLGDASLSELFSGFKTDDMSQVAAFEFLLSDTLVYSG